MNRRGVCYDVGRVMWGQDWHPEFSAEQARRELQIIRDDLHYNAVRICGQDQGSHHIMRHPDGRLHVEEPWP